MTHEEIVIAEGPVLLLGGSMTDGAHRAMHDLRAMEEMAEAPVVAVDSGARMALAADIPVTAVVGDFDSLSAEELARFNPAIVHRIEEQETTDFDKALRSVRAPVVVGAGFHGARMDHHLAAISVLMRHADRPCILVGPEDVICLCPPEVALDLTPGSWLSLFPLATVRGTSTGLEWPIDPLTFIPGGRIGTSNRVTDGAVTLTMQDPAMLLILPRPALRPLLAALSQCPARWPVRGK